MSREFDVLLAAVDPVAGEMAREVLEGAGIPSMMHGPDFDMAELGVLAHSQVRRRDLLVPKGQRERARAALVEAWGEEDVVRHEPH